VVDVKTAAIVREPSCAYHTVIIGGEEDQATVFEGMIDGSEVVASGWVAYLGDFPNLTDVGKLRFAEFSDFLDAEA